MPRHVVTYDSLSLAARLAAGLIAVERWLRAVSIEDGQVTAVLEHMWHWMAVDETTFDDWFGVDSPLLEAALENGPLPPQVESVCSAAGVLPGTLLTLLHDVVDLIYGHVYAGISWDVGLPELDRIRVTVAAAGVHLPDAEQLGTSPVSEAGLWGDPSPSTVSRWRGLS